MIRARKGVLLPASIFDYLGNNFRVGFGRRDFKEGLHQVGDFLGDYSKGRIPCRV